MDVESVDAGFLCSIISGVGQTVKVGQKIAVIADTMGECCTPGFFVDSAHWAALY